MLRTSLRSKISVALAVIVFCGPGSLCAQNIVTNPGFESGDFSPGWILTPGPSGSSTTVDPIFPHSGGYAVDCSQFDEFDTISQNISTVAGRSYDLSFWLASFDGGGLGTTLEVRVWWNGVVVLDRTNDPHDLPYTQVFVSNLVATSSSTALRFDIRNDPGTYFLDDISVVTPQWIKTFSKSGTTATMTIDSLTGYSYQLQRSDTLLPGTFADLGSAQTGTGSPLTFIDSAATGSAAFYRVLISFTSQANPGTLKPARHNAKLDALDAMKRAQRLRAK